MIPSVTGTLLLAQLVVVFQSVLICPLHVLTSVAPIQYPGSKPPDATVTDVFIAPSPVPSSLSEFQ